MKNQELAGKAQTVLGPVEGSDLGNILPHEHLLVDLRCYMVAPKTTQENKLAYKKIALDNLWFSRHNLFNCEHNMLLDDEEMAVREVGYFRDSGGKTIVEVTPIGCGRNPHGMVKIAKLSGINIIMGTSYYVALSYSPEMKIESKSEEDIAEEFIKEIQVGIDETGIKAGIIGEIGCSWPVDEREKKVLRAAGIAQQETGAVVSIHPGPDENAPFDHLKMLEEVGADPSRVIICHMTRTFPPSANIARAKLAEKGCYLEYDWFGREGVQPASLISRNERVNDVTRIFQIIDLVNEGYGDRILVSQDICFKVMLRSYGGGGYGYILDMAVPEMMRMGLSQQMINIMLVDNPRRALSFV